jgi:hypothetical protein
MEESLLVFALEENIRSKILQEIVKHEVFVKPGTTP